MAFVGFEDELQGYRSVFSWNELIEYLNGEKLSSEEGSGGVVFWSGERGSVMREKIMSVLKRMDLEDGSLMQFWAVGVEERRRQRHRYLTIREQPFCVSGWSPVRRRNILINMMSLSSSTEVAAATPTPWFDGFVFRKGGCWYRKVCMDEVCLVHELEDIAAAGPVRRVYRNKRPESSPDLMLYSSHEFPLRDHAARCGFTSYLALPVFAALDSHDCVGVLEILSPTPGAGGIDHYALPFRELLKEVELGSSIHDMITINHDYSEISSILFSPVEAIPQVHLAQIWIPCRKWKCMNSEEDSILCCMQRADYKEASDYDDDSDGRMKEYIKACGFHHQRIHPNCSSSQSLSISLSHYAHKARLFHRLLLCLESRHTDAIYVVEYFLDARRDSQLHYLIKVMEMQLKGNFRFTCEGQELLGLGPNLNLNLSELEFEVKIRNQRRSNLLDYMCEEQPRRGHESGWLFCKREESKIERGMKKIAAKLFINRFRLVQFWAPKMGQGRRLYLETEEQPFALSYLDDGLTSYRKECTKHHYFVDEEAKTEELGPPGRVFRSGHMEISPDLRLYSTDEFPLRSHAVECCSFPHYIALPVFEDHKCVGVLEFVGFTYAELNLIQQLLTDANVCWSHHDGVSRDEISSRWRRRQRRMSGYEAALSEVREALLSLSTKIPQLCLAEAWVPALPNGTNINNLNSCMELALVFSTKKKKKIVNFNYMADENHWWSHVHPRKGIVGMVLASENKSCFSPDLCDLSIDQEPLAHFLIRQRRGLCFAICLQSSHTEDLPYVLKFFLNPLSPSSPGAKHLQTFLKLLLPALRLKLKTFHIASGKPLDDDGMVVDIIEFSKANIFPPFCDSDTFPFKFKRVPYEHQHSDEDDEQTVQSSVVSLLKRARSEDDYDIIETPFVNRLIDFQEELGVGVGRPVIKRVCKDNCVYKKRSEGTQHLCDEVKEDEKVIIIVKHEHDDAVILFETRLSLGVNKIREEVGARLDLDAATLKLKYWDEDSNWDVAAKSYLDAATPNPKLKYSRRSGCKILLGCDDDFKLCPMRRTRTGQPCIRLFSELIN